MNTPRKMFAWNMSIVGVAGLAAGLFLLLVPYSDRHSQWLLYWVIGTFVPILTVSLVLGISLQRRQKAARASGLRLCWKCEYPLDVSEGPVKCPECGSIQGQR